MAINVDIIMYLFFGSRSDVNHASRPWLETAGCDSNQNRGIWAIDRSVEQLLFFVVGHCKLVFFIVNLAFRTSSLYWMRPCDKKRMASICLTIPSNELPSNHHHEQQQNRSESFPSEKKTLPPDQTLFRFDISVVPSRPDSEAYKEHTDGAGHRMKSILEAIAIAWHNKSRVGSRG